MNDHSTLHVRGLVSNRQGLWPLSLLCLAATGWPASWPHDMYTKSKLLKAAQAVNSVTCTTSPLPEAAQVMKLCNYGATIFLAFMVYGIVCLSSSN